MRNKHKTVIHHISEIIPSEISSNEFHVTYNMPMLDGRAFHLLGCGFRDSVAGSGLGQWCRLAWRLWFVGDDLQQKTLLHDCLLTTQPVLWVELRTSPSTLQVLGSILISKPLGYRSTLSLCPAPPKARYMTLITLTNKIAPSCSEVMHEVPDRENDSIPNVHTQMKIWNESPSPHMNHCLNYISAEWLQTFICLRAQHTHKRAQTSNIVMATCSSMNLIAKQSEASHMTPCALECKVFAVRKPTKQYKLQLHDA